MTYSQNRDLRIDRQGIVLLLIVGVLVLLLTAAMLWIGLR
jgi:hypothetical protein